MNKKELIAESKKWKLEDRIKLCREKAAIGDSVAVYKSGGLLKRGTIVKLTTAGANVYNPNFRKDGEFDSAENAEFFFFSNRVKGEVGGMILLQD